MDWGVQLRGVHFFVTFPMNCGEWNETLYARLPDLLGSGKGLARETSTRPFALFAH